MNANELPSILKLKPRDTGTATSASGGTLYLRYCSGCHGSDLTGGDNAAPPLTSVSQRKPEEVSNIIRKGTGRMPGFGDLGEGAVTAITRYLITGESRQASAAERDARISLKYAIDGYIWFQDPQGYPAVKPPWGTLTAIDLDRNRFAWRHPFGQYPQLVAQGMRDTGTQNYGGSVATAGGLLFIGATVFDNRFRAFNKRTGELLWETVLPAAATSSPAVYEVDSREYVLIGAGGGRFGIRSGGTYHAFALPR